jgi:hypothetical protein
MTADRRGLQVLSQTLSTVEGSAVEGMSASLEGAAEAMIYHENTKGGKHERRGVL